MTVFCAQESPEAFLAACASGLPEQAREASLRDLQNLEITFRWGCDPGEALTRDLVISSAFPPPTLTWHEGYSPAWKRRKR